MDIDLYGDPRVRQAVWNNIAVSETGCWLWMKYLNEDGYGRGYAVAGGRLTMAHWITFEALVRRVNYPSEELDHKCRVRNCVRPSHLEAVPHKVNRARQAAVITHCKYGHEFTVENTSYQTFPSGRKQRHCLACRKRRNSKKSVDVQVDM